MVVLDHGHNIHDAIKRLDKTRRNPEENDINCNIPLPKFPIPNLKGNDLQGVYMVTYLNPSWIHNIGHPEPVL